MKKSLKEQLPETFVLRMKELLGSEYEAFSDSYEERTYAGLRMNTLKITPEEYLKLTGQTLESVSWCPTGFYYNGSPGIFKKSAVSRRFILYPGTECHVSGPGTSCFAGRCYP